MLNREKRVELEEKEVILYSEREKVIYRPTPFEIFFNE
jgi:hypothetical protein